MRLAVALIILAFAAAALLASHQNKHQALLIDEAQASTIICNPVLVPGTPKDRKVQKA